MSSIKPSNKECESMGYLYYWYYSGWDRHTIKGEVFYKELFLYPSFGSHSANLVQLQTTTIHQKYGTEKPPPLHTHTHTTILYRSSPSGIIFFLKTNYLHSQDGCEHTWSQNYRYYCYDTHTHTCTNTSSYITDNVIPPSIITSPASQHVYVCMCVCVCVCVCVR